MNAATSIADRYRRFAAEQAAGVSPTFHDWALAVADDDELLRLLRELPEGKQQPNLVFAAARLHGARPGDAASLREIVTHRWDDVRGTVLERATQTNEAARGAATLLGLERIDGPIALFEVGASAGLCLVPDRYSYVFGDGSRLDPVDGPSAVTIPIALAGGLVPPRRMPEIVWRAGLDLDPLDPADPGDRAWLETLVWPEHEERRRRVAEAARIAAASGVRVRRGDLLRDLPGPAADAPREATLVVTHSATLAYLDDEQRRSAVEAIAATGARRLSFEARGVDPAVPPTDVPTAPETLFVAALDGVPYALADGHGSRLSAL